MSRISSAASWLTLALGFAVFMGGCGETAKKPSDSGKSGDSSKTTSAAKDSKSEADSEAAEIKAALAKLSDEDRAVAEKQKTCPVGGGALGTMGTPIKKEVKGRTVFLCCSGCEGALESEPDKYLAVLDGKPADAKP